MKKAIHVSGLTLMKVWAEKGFPLIMLAAAFAFAGLFSFAFKGSTGPSKIPLAVADGDGSALSQRVADELASSGAYTVFLMTEAQIKSGIREGRLEAGFVVPQGFEDSLAGPDPLGIEVISIAASKLVAAASSIIQKTVSEHALFLVVDEFTQEAAVSFGLQGLVRGKDVASNTLLDLKDKPKLQLVHQKVFKQDREGSGQPSQSTVSFGVFLMFIMFTVTFLSGDILQERHDGTWARLLTTPTSPKSILTGKILGTYAAGLVQTGVLLLSGRFVFGMDYGPAPLAVAAIFLFFLFCATGLGVLLSTLVRTVPQFQALVPIVVVATSMLGGCYWPLEIVPKTMQFVGKLTPQAWAMNALTRVISGEGGLSAVCGSLAVMAGFSILFFAAGATRVRFE